MRFSIIIPLYNKRNFIAHSIESVLNQTFGDFECIIVDDGSTDDSLSIVKHFDDDRIKIVSKENGGVSSARNVGIGVAQYPYLAFLDADDYWSESYLEKMSLLIDTYPNRGLYFSSHYIVHSPAKVAVISSPELAAIGQSTVFNLYQYFKDYHVCGWSLHTSCCIIDKTVLNKVGGFDARISFYEDYDLFTRIALVSDFVYLNEPLTFYNCDVPADNRLTGNRPLIRKHWVNYILSGSLSQSKDKNVTYLINNMAVFLLRRYRENGLQMAQVNEIRNLISIRCLSIKSLLLYYLPVWLITLLTKNKKDNIYQSNYI